MHLFSKLLLVGAFSWAMFGITPKKNTQQTLYGTDSTSNNVAKLLAGLPTEGEVFQGLAKLPACQKHYTAFQQSWQALTNKRLSKIQAWRDKELLDWKTKTYNVFYPFSGPDFLNAYQLFPEADNYLLLGLEQVGQLPKINDLKGAYLDNYLTNVRQGLSEIFDRNYFITSRMSGAVKGVLPIISVFLARTNNDIINIQKIFLQKDGKAIYTTLGDNSKQLLAGVRIIFKNKDRQLTQHLYYFGTDVSDAHIANKPELLTFLKGFEDKVTLIKSASYLLHTVPFGTMRNLILQQSKAVLQDDTGVPYKYFSTNTWETQLYGKYAKPISDFNYGYQKDLDAVFLIDKNIKPINFTFGYHWWTDKSSILYFKKK